MSNCFHFSGIAIYDLKRVKGLSFSVTKASCLGAAAANKMQQVVVPLCDYIVQLHSPALLFIIVTQCKVLLLVVCYQGCGGEGKRGEDALTHFFPDRGRVPHYLLKPV